MGQTRWMVSISSLLGRSGFFTRKLRLPIPANGLVLDVGSGGDPHPRADVLVDLVIEGDAQRTFAFREHGHVVVGDINRLPFKDDAFSYVICSHVLEHVDDPSVASSELSRIGGSGYVETPSNLHEYMFPIGWHRWLVQESDGTLIFEAKEDPFLNTTIGGYFRAMWGKDKRFMAFVWSHTDDLFVQHHWIGGLTVRVEGMPTWRLDEDPLVAGDLPTDSPLKRTVYSLLARVVYLRNSRMRPHDRT